MDTFKFNGTWSYRLSLATLSTLRSPDLYHRHSRLKAQPPHVLELAEKELALYKELQNGLVEVELLEDIDSPPEPEASQLRTVDFIREHQSGIITAIYERFREIYPEAIEEEIFGSTRCDKERYPPLEKKEDLKTVLGIEKIEILPEAKEGLSYYTINFLSSWDVLIDGFYQYGFHVLMHRYDIIGWGGNWGFDLENVYEDNGGDYEKRMQELNTAFQSLDTLIEPHEKYGTLRPSQVMANESLPLRLLSKDKTDAFIALVETGKLSLENPQFQWPGIIESAIAHKNKEVLEYLIKKGILERVHLNEHTDRKSVV